MLSNYFRELLEKHNRVIIPDFGAFLVKDTGDIRSLANISFSPFLRYNDGLVEAFLAEKDGLTKAEATKQVKDYVDLLKVELEKGTQVNLLKLGYFYMDSRGTIQFQLDLNEGSNSPTINKGIETSTIVEKVQEKTEPTPEIKNPEPIISSPIIPEKKEPVVIPAPEIKNIPIEPPKVSKQLPKQVLKTSKTKTSAAPQPNKEEKNAAISNSTTNSMGKSENKSKTSGKSGKGYWVLITSLIILLIVIIWQYDNIVKVFDNNSKAKTAANSTSIVSDSLSTKGINDTKDSISVSEKPSGPVYVKPIIDKPENKFLVIVGSFTNKENAETQLKKLIDQGYQPIIIVRSNGMHSIVISGHTTKEEAKLSLESYIKKNGEGWIMSR